ncbi:hypothetical protein DC498_10060 [Terrimonas sp.]|nr:hypothetical protein DC498_10060 [Terrimonas sp.]
MLCIPKNKYWNRIYFCSSSVQWIEDVVWTTNTTFILTGISKWQNKRKTSVIFLGDIVNQTLVQYINENEATFQTKNHLSPALKRLRIKGS